MTNYEYLAIVVRWVDGDTVWLDVDLGFRTRSVTDFRLWGIDTPEVGQPGRNEAKAAAEQMAPVGAKVNIMTYKNPDKYGRWLVDIVTLDGLKSLNQRLILFGHAKPYFGGKKTD